MPNCWCYGCYTRPRSYAFPPQTRTESSSIFLSFFCILHRNILKLKKSLGLCLFSVSITSFVKHLCKCFTKNYSSFWSAMIYLFLQLSVCFMLIIRTIKPWHRNASFPEDACFLCWEKTRNRTPEDAAQTEDGACSPGAAEWGDEMRPCQKPTVASAGRERRVMDAPGYVHG